MSSTAARPGFFARAARVLRPGHEHSAYSATLLLIVAQIASRGMGYLREAYVAWAFGAGGRTDAFYAAFQLPDLLYYFVAGTAISSTFVPIYTRYIAEGREQDADRVLSVILTTVLAVFSAAVVLAEIFAPVLVHAFFPGYDAEKLALCVRLTRILLPMQLFFFVGGIFSAVLLARRQFLVPAITPIIYTLGIILGGVLLSSRVGMAGLAIGAVAGAFAGPFLINAIGAARTGVRVRPQFDLRNEGFREWLRISIPLMLGVSLGTADEWIMRWFASHDEGAITLLSYAKRLFNFPYGVLGLAIGTASMTFFSRLFSEKKLADFGRATNAAVYRAAAASFLVSAWLIAAAVPAFDLAMRRGQLTFGHSQQSALYFAIFSASLAFWTAQTLYARAFYATRDTLTPMLAATGLTVASIPLFAVMFRAWGIAGLAIASDVGIAAQTLVLAWLLARRGLVRAGELNWTELGKALLTAAAAAALGIFVARAAPLDGSHLADLKSLALVTTTWGAAVAAGLWLTRSELPRVLLRRSSS
jgi:putative peptidoglycan lipid II flippase